MEMNSIETLLNEQLRDLYSAEGQLLKALPKMARKASNESLREAFEDHLEETKVHITRLQEIGETLGIKLGGHKCKAMEGLIEEGSEMLEADGEDAVIDAGLVAAAQRVEHYEISAYGTARALANRVGEEQVAELLGQTLDEESAADEKLTQICEGELLANATLREDSSEGGEDSESSEDGGEEPQRTGGRTSTGRNANSRAGKSGKARGTSAPSKRGANSNTRAGSPTRAGSRSGGKSRASSGTRGRQSRSGASR
jgi:ferritin-like metal-binding protein YciE